MTWWDGFAGIPATGQPVRMTGITIYHVIDGQITEARSNFDQLGLLQPLGAIPAGTGAPLGDPHDHLQSPYCGRFCPCSAGHGQFRHACRR